MDRSDVGAYKRFLVGRVRHGGMHVPARHTGVSELLNVFIRSLVVNLDIANASKSAEPGVSCRLDSTRADNQVAVKPFSGAVLCRLGNLARMVEGVNPETSLLQYKVDDQSLESMQ